jgi:hypothetical protein
MMKDYWLSSALLLLMTIPGLSQQPLGSLHEDVHVTESRFGIVCDPFAGRCTITQQLVATVGTRKLELQRYESKVEPLLALGIYPGQLVSGKNVPSYRLDESYVLTYPDGKTEKFQVVGISQ